VTTSDEVDSGSIDIIDERGNRTNSVEFLRPVVLRLTFRASKPLQQVTFSIGLHTTDFVYLTANNTAYAPMDFEKGVHSVELEIKSLTLLPGVYCVLAWMGRAYGRTVFAGENLASFRVFSRDYAITRQRDRAILHMDAVWHLHGEQVRTDSRVA
jgi:hypothetical protein